MDKNTLLTQLADEETAARVLMSALSSPGPQIRPHLQRSITLLEELVSPADPADKLTELKIIEPTERDRAVQLISQVRGEDPISERDVYWLLSSIARVRRSALRGWRVQRHLGPMLAYSAAGIAIVALSIGAILLVKPKPAPSRPGLSIPGVSVLSITQGWGLPGLNKSVGGNPLSVGGNRHESGIGTHATSKIILEIRQPEAKALTGLCGLDDEVGLKGSIKCVIRVNDHISHESPILKLKERTDPFTIPVKDGDKVELLIEDGGDGGSHDHADWVSLRVDK